MKLILGDCLEKLKEIEDNTIDSVVTDPPYGIKFLSKKWDYQIPTVDIWKEVLRVLKPGGHILVACGTKTYHRMAVNIEDAGFEVRDIIAWIYGTGFAKNYDIGKKIEKMKGWGTALKPAMELWTLARKPLSEKNIVSNVLKWGTGGININESRVPVGENDKKPKFPEGEYSTDTTVGKIRNELRTTDKDTASRYPANLIHDGSEEVMKEFDKVGNRKSGGGRKGENGKRCYLKTDKKKQIFGKLGRGEYEHYDPERDDYYTIRPTYPGGGSAARFFYCAKASKSEKNAGLEDFEIKQVMGGGGLTNVGDKYGSIEAKQQNTHPTVKPLKLMEYLITLITPSNGIVLDPFMGSGSTGVACIRKDFDFIGIELSEEYYEIAKARIKHDFIPNKEIENKKQPDLFEK